MNEKRLSLMETRLANIGLDGITAIEARALINRIRELTGELEIERQERQGVERALEQAVQFAGIRRYRAMSRTGVSSSANYAHKILFPELYKWLEEKGK